MVKLCPKCSKKQVVKNGMQRGKQPYKCTFCFHRFLGKSREVSKESSQASLRREYVEGKQTYQQIGDKIGKSKKTVQRIFDKSVLEKNYFYNKNLSKSPIIIIADCTRFGEEGFLVIKSHEHKKILYSKSFEGGEVVKLYLDALDFLKADGWIFKGIVCDGLSGLKESLHGLIPFQSCQFHQVKNIVKYLTRRPKKESANILLSLAYNLKNLTKKEFEKQLNDRFLMYEEQLKKKSFNRSKSLKQGGKKRRYTYKNLRSAYRSLKNNLNYLFTYETVPGMPNTTNELEGYFKLIKTKVSIHNGLNKKRKKKLILGLFGL